MSGRVVGDSVAPAAPDHPSLCPTEDPDRVRVVGAAIAGPAVDVRGPGMPVAARVRQHSEMISKPLVAGPAKVAWRLLPDSLGTGQ